MQNENITADAAAEIANAETVAPATTTETTVMVKPVRKPRAAKSATTDAKPVKASGKTTFVETPVIAKPDQNVERSARIAAERSTVSALYAAFEANRLSVPIKTLSAFKISASHAHPVARGVTTRQCAAVALAFSAAGKKLATGATAARVFNIDGKPFALENGVMRDAIASGLITVSGDSPAAEKLTLSKRAPAEITGNLGSRVTAIGKLA